MSGRRPPAMFESNDFVSKAAGVGGANAGTSLRSALRVPVHSPVTDDDLPVVVSGADASLVLSVSPVDRRLSPYVCSWQKRTLDLALGVPLTVLALPFIVGSALAAAVSLRAWPFFIQRRVGRDGELFTVVKIRTLPCRTPRYASKDEIAAVETTRTGRYLRASHADELPQLLLVCLGRMSLVGPRPEMESLVDRFHPDDAALRTRVRPGCTGLWQVSAASQGLISDAPEYDRAYVGHASARLDLYLLMATALVAMGFRPRDFDGRYRARFGFEI
jgi:lipopolysaccharide/colanic/teichoic acid biosynthesis glycosyltransferase